MSVENISFKTKEKRKYNLTSIILNTSLTLFFSYTTLQFVYVNSELNKSTDKEGFCYALEKKIDSRPIYYMPLNTGQNYVNMISCNKYKNSKE